VAGEFGVGVKIATLNQELRTDSGQLRSASDQMLAFAIEEAGRANERASRNEQQTAGLQLKAARLNAKAEGLRKEAEDERTARLQLEKQIQPRTFEFSQIDEIAKPLKPFAPALTGRKITVGSYSFDQEGIVFAVEIWNVLNRAGINADASDVGTLMPIGMMQTGVIIDGRTTDRDIVQALGKTISSHAGNTPIHMEWDSSKHSDLSIFVAAKPIAGLPDIIPNKP
jgi:hypothetical protein